MPPMRATACSFAGCARPRDAELDPDELVERADEPLVDAAARAGDGARLRAGAALHRPRQGLSAWRRVVAPARRPEPAERRRSTSRAVLDIQRGRAADRRAASRHLGRARTGRPASCRRARFAVEAGDLLALPGRRRRPERLLAERIEDGREPRLCAAARRQRSGPAPLKPPRARAARADRAVRDSRRCASSISRRRTAMEAHAPRLAVFADPWPGTVAVYRATEGGGFRLADDADAARDDGQAHAPLAAGPLGAVRPRQRDRGGAFRRRAREPARHRRARRRQRRGREDERRATWEVLQFAAGGADRAAALPADAAACAASAAASRRWRRAPSDGRGLRAARHAPWCRCRCGPMQLGLPLRYRFGPARDDHAAPTLLELTITAEGEGLQPFAPVQLRARRDAGSGDVALAWIRRTRFGGDRLGAGRGAAERGARGLPARDLRRRRRGQARPTSTSPGVHLLGGATRRPIRRAGDRFHCSRRAAQRRRSGRATRSQEHRSCLRRRAFARLPLLAAEQAQKHVTHNEALGAARRDRAALGQGPRPRGAARLARRGRPLHRRGERDRRVGRRRRADIAVLAGRRLGFSRAARGLALLGGRRERAPRSSTARPGSTAARRSARCRTCRCSASARRPTRRTRSRPSSTRRCGRRRRQPRAATATSATR